MSSITIIICVLTVLFKTGICASLGNTAGEKILNLGDSQKIVKNTATKGQFPYVVHLLIIANTTTQVCTGTIVAKSYVVTAAYCFSWDFLSGTAQKVIVDAGSTDGFIEWNPLTSEQTVVSTSWWIHPAYNSTSKENDIAIITLGGAFWWTSAVSALALPSPSATFAEGTSCTIIGWGYGGYLKYGISSTLQYGSANILSQANCTVKLGTDYWSYLRDSEICTMSGTAAPCLGDFGGPLVCTGTARDGSTGLVLAGIMTNSPYSCSVWTSAINTRVSSFSDLINSKTGGTSSTTSPRFLLGAVAFICAIKLLPA